MAGIAEKTVDIAQTGTGNDPFGAYPAMFGAQEEEQFSLQFSAGGKIGMPPLTPEGTVSAAVPVRQSLSQSGAGRDHGNRPSGIRNPPIEDSHVFRSEQIDAEGIGFKIIDQFHRRQPQDPCQLGSIHTPGEVRRSDPSLQNRSGNAETGPLRRQPRFGAEAADDLIEAPASLLEKRFSSNGVSLPSADSK